jgi:hypothetical protein
LEQTRILFAKAGLNHIALSSTGPTSRENPSRRSDHIKEFGTGALGATISSEFHRRLHTRLFIFFQSNHSLFIKLHMRRSVYIQMVTRCDFSTPAQ